MTPFHGAVNGEKILQYRILRLLGKGGMGEVFLTEDTILQRRVALKFLVIRRSMLARIRSHAKREDRLMPGQRLQTPAHPIITFIHTAEILIDVNCKAWSDCSSVH